MSLRQHVIQFGQLIIKEVTGTSQYGLPIQVDAWEQRRGNIIPFKGFCEQMPKILNIFHQEGSGNMETNGWKVILFSIASSLLLHIIRHFKKKKP